MRSTGIRVAALVIVLSALGGAALAALREVQKNSYPGEITTRTAQFQGDQFSPRELLGWDPRRGRFFQSRLFTWQQGHVVALRLGSLQFAPQILIYAPSGQLLADSVDHSSVSRGTDGAAWVDIQYSVPRTMQYTVVATTLQPNAQGFYRLDVHVLVDDGGGTPPVQPPPPGRAPCACPPGSSQGFRMPGQPTVCTNARGQVVPPIPPGCID